MPIPDFQSIMLPLLKFAADTQEHSIHEAVETLAKVFVLSEQDRNELYPSGDQKKPKFDHRVAWARTYLKQASLIQDTRRAHFKITKRGLDVLSQKPNRVDMKYLEQFPEYQDFKNRTRSKAERSSVDSTITETENVATPRESMSLSYQKLRETLAQELLDEVKRQHSSFFERLVVDLLVKMGYGGSIRDAGQAIGGVGDEGIDGIIKEDKLGLDVIYLQAKRWASDNTVGRQEIQQFAGALQGKRAQKGVFITTSDFTKEARAFVEGINSKIVLINGEELAQLMIDHNVGVAIETVYELKRVDSDYFSGE